MSGKGKKKGTGFSYKKVDLTRFAYDVIRYTTLKFKVPENAIAVLGGSSNDYGHDDYLSVVCGQIMDSQIVLRHTVNVTFRKHFEINRLASNELIGKLMQEVMDKTLREFEFASKAMVVASLAAVCELFLFLYSEKIDFRPRRLVTFWIQCYLNLNKKEFEDAGGLKGLYDYSRCRNLKNMDAFLNSFIEDHCVSYDNSSKSETLDVFYIKEISKEKKRKSLASKDNKESEATSLKDQIIHLNFGNVVVVQASQPYEASGGNVPQDTGLGIFPPDKVLKLPSPSVASSQDPSAETSEQQQHRRYLTLNERSEMINSRLHASIQRGLGQPSSDSSKKKQSNVSFLKGTAPFCRLLGARPKTRGESSSQTDMPIPCPNVEQGSGERSSDSSGTEQSSK